MVQEIISNMTRNRINEKKRTNSFFKQISNMTLFAKQRNTKNNMITVGSWVKTTIGHWHPSFDSYPSNTLLTGTVLKAVAKGMWDVFYDDGFHDPIVSFSSRSLILVQGNISAEPYGKRQSTVEMNLSSKYATKFFKTSSPAATEKHFPYLMPTSSPFIDITNEVNNIVPPKSLHQTSKNNNLLTLASLAEERSFDFETRLAPTKPAPTKKDFLHADSDYMTDDSFEEENKVMDLDHEDNVIAANTYLKGLVGQVFKVSTEKKKNTSIG